MLTIANAVLEHSIRIMFFRHDGTGLPVKRSGMLYLLMAVAVLSRVLRDTLNPAGFDAMATALGSGVYLAALILLFRPSSMAALVMANMFGYVLTGALYFFGIENGWLNAAIMIWELVALTVVLRRVVRRTQSQAKK